MAESSALGALASHSELIGLYWQLGRLFVSRQRAEGWAVDRFGPLYAPLAAPDGVRSEKRTKVILAVRLRPLDGSDIPTDPWSHL